MIDAKRSLTSPRVSDRSTANHFGLTFLARSINVKGTKADLDNLVRLESKTGVRIEKLSDFPEDEVLFKAGSRFEVLSVEERAEGFVVKLLDVN
jgi:hypothetical protein